MTGVDREEVETGGWLAFCIHADGRSGPGISWHF